MTMIKVSKPRFPHAREEIRWLALQNGYAVHSASITVCYYHHAALNKGVEFRYTINGDLKSAVFYNDRHQIVDEINLYPPRKNKRADAIAMLKRHARGYDD